MRLGIIGLPQSGKTTLFNALTRGTQPTGASTGKIEVHTAVVDVPDPRVDRLSAMFKPKKTIYAKVTYADIAGLDGSAGKTRHLRHAAQPAHPDGRLHPRGALLSRMTTCRTLTAASTRRAISQPWTASSSSTT